MLRQYVGHTHLPVTTRFADPTIQVAKLNQELAVAKSAAVQDRTAQLEARLRTLAESVVTKQGQLDDLRSENVRQGGRQ